MKADGTPDTVGEKRYQAGAVAETVMQDGQLEWQVTLSDGRVSDTGTLAHADHWSAMP